MESDKELTTLGAKRLTTYSERKRKRGGTSCCIPTCDSNTKWNPELSFFYQFLADRKLREMWLNYIPQLHCPFRNSSVLQKMCLKESILHTSKMLASWRPFPFQVKRYHFTHDALLQCKLSIIRSNLR